MSDYNVKVNNMTANNSIINISLHIPIAFCNTCLSLVSTAKYELIQNKKDLIRIIPGLCPKIQIIDTLCINQFNKTIDQLFTHITRHEATSTICVMTNFCQLSGMN